MQGAFCFGDHSRRQATIAYEQYGVQRVAQATEVFALAFGQFHGANSKGQPPEPGSYLAEYALEFAVRGLKRHPATRINTPQVSGAYPSSELWLLASALGMV